MTWLDCVMLVVIVISALVAVFRGFVREIVSLAVWAVGIFLTIHYMTDLRGFVSQWASSLYLQYIIVVLFALVLILVVGFILSKAFSLATKASMMGAMDKFLGLLFGLVRGILIVAFLAMLIPLAGFMPSAAGSHSVLMPVVSPISDWMRGSIPEDLQAKLPAIHAHVNNLKQYG